jgi:hypothetical protein
MTWGLQVHRTLHHRGEDTAWVTWDADANGTISRFGTLIGLLGVSPRRQLELLPYFVLSATNPAADAPYDEVEEFRNIGLDLRYALTPNLGLNVTIQPDFGQVEADPTIVNRSPFETFYEEKRPFFVEGARYFDHRSFDLFYSRRIGLDEEDSRIRLAGKLAGKTASNLSVAGLYALTDVPDPGRAHNPVRSGEDTTHYLVGRLGKDFADGKHHLSVMQTAVVRSRPRLEGDDDDDRASRDGFTSGADFGLSFLDRAIAVRGSVVGSITDPSNVKGHPDVPHDPIHGTGGALTVGKYGGPLRGDVWGRWEHDRLDLNDIGFLDKSDEIASGAWLGWSHSPTDPDSDLNSANIDLTLHGSWIYAGRSAFAVDGKPLWSYPAGQPRSLGGSLSGYLELRNYWGLSFGADYQAPQTDQYATRGGPPLVRPQRGGGWVGFHSDSRRAFRFELHAQYSRDAAGSSSFELDPRIDWNPATWMKNRLTGYVYFSADRAAYVTTVDHGDPSLGIGGESPIFATLVENQVGLELRSSILFSRNQFLELYCEPFLANGNFRGARRLRTPLSYDLVGYPKTGLSEDPSDDVDVDDFDDFGASINLNAVYRWEYWPNSTLYLVWNHTRWEGGSRGENPELGLRLSARPLLGVEPENTILVKITRWFRI